MARSSGGGWDDSLGLVTAGAVLTGLGVAMLLGAIVLARRRRDQGAADDHAAR